MSTITQDTIVHLQGVAQRVRCHVLRTISRAGVGHPGGSLSEADILIALYFHVMNVDPTRPDWKQRDRFVLSKGHGAAGLYATLAERGFFPAERLETFGRIDSHLQVHPDMHMVPGIEISTGALGQGISVALGIALGARLNGDTYHVYCLIGDGENQEGQVWEAAEVAAHYKVDNLTVILDYNRVQLMGPLKEILEMSSMAQKWQSFNWYVLEVDGHNIQALVGALEAARQHKRQPAIIIAHTIKGKGVSFMEGKSAWHGRPPDSNELAQALKELQCAGIGGADD
jgi:transketolase